VVATTEQIVRVGVVPATLSRPYRMPLLIPAALRPPATPQSSACVAGAMIAATRPTRPVRSHHWKLPPRHYHPHLALDALQQRRKRAIPYSRHQQVPRKSLVRELIDISPGRNPSTRRWAEQAAHANPHSSVDHQVRVEVIPPRRIAIFPQSSVNRWAKTWGSTPSRAATRLAIESG